MSLTQVRPPEQQREKKSRFWPQRGMKIGAGALGGAVLLVLGYLAALVVALGPVTAYRMMTNLNSDINTYKIFPTRTIAEADRFPPCSREA